MNWILKKKDILLIIMCLLIINIPFISQTANNIYVLFIEALALFFLKNINKRIVEDNIYIVLFSLIIIFCTWINLGFSTRTVNAVVTGVRYFLLFYLCHFLCKRYSLQFIISKFRIFIYLMVCLADIAILIVLLTNGISEHGGAYNVYIIGNKFVVSYYHMFCLALYQMDITKFNKYDKLKFICLALFSIGVCCIIECNTGVIGCLVVVLIRILSWGKKTLIEFLSKPVVFCAIFACLNFVLLGTNFLLKDNFITRLLMEYSHTSKILTGRLDMYMIALSEFKKFPLIGRGINCTIVEDVLSWGNAQNGFLKIMIDFGMLGVVSFFALCFNSLKIKTYTYRLQNNNIRFGIIAFLYGMMICSLVEINISSLFIVAIALYSAAKKYYWNLGN